MSRRLHTVAIIGHTGRMGAMLMERLTLAGLVAQGVDQPLTHEALARVCSTADAVIVCVPAAVFAEVCARVVPHLAANAILVDIASVKVLPLLSMEKLYSGPVVGSHPLFGPHPKPEDHAVCVTPGQRASEDDIAAVELLFHTLGCSTFRSTAEEHDRAMAAIQGLNFITSVAYFAMLSSQKNLTPFLTPSLQRRTEAARSMLTSDAELFTGIFATNPLSQDVVREYRSYLNLAAGGDIDILAALARRWFEDGLPRS